MQLRNELCAATDFGSVKWPRTSELFGHTRFIPQNRHGPCFRSFPSHRYATTARCFASNVRRTHNSQFQFQYLKHRRPFPEWKIHSQNQCGTLSSFLRLFGKATSHLLPWWAHSPLHRSRPRHNVTNEPTLDPTVVFVVPHLVH